MAKKQAGKGETAFPKQCCGCLTWIRRSRPVLKLNADTGMQSRSSLNGTEIDGAGRQMRRLQVDTIAEDDGLAEREPRLRARLA
jgi:hypothetical protein